MRPAYETAQDLKNERAVADRLERAWVCDFVKTPNFYSIDFLISRNGKGKAFAEIKCRNATYPEMLLSLHKWQSLLAASRDTGLPSMLIYAIGGDVYWMEVKQTPLEICVGGRKDRNDDQDMEPCVLIPIRMMNIL